MPELPEVETVKRGLDPVLSGATLQSIALNRPDLRVPFPDNMAKRLQGRQCMTLRRRGKYIWIDFDHGETLVVHLGMSGSFTINPPENKKHDHVILETDAGHIIHYNDPRRFGMFFIVPTGFEDTHSAFATMGPEPLGNAFHVDYLHGRFKTIKSPIKTALLDQSIVAGIGNIYACEALYMAGISPLRPSHDLTISECDTLTQSIISVLRDAIEAGGSSLRDHKQTDGSMGYFQHAFHVYNREGSICKETGDIIVRIVQSGRSTFYCPEKQH